MSFMVGVGGRRLAVAMISLIPSAGFAQDISGLPTREQVELPEIDRAEDRGRIDIRDRTAPSEPCAFSSSTLGIDLARVRYVPIVGEPPLPAEISQLIVGVQPAPGMQPLSNLCRVRDAASERLAAAGYLASVQIPPQEITTGEAKLQVILARLVEIKLEGAPGPYGDTLAARAAQLKALRPFNRFAAERVLLLAGDVPGLEVAMTLRSAGTTPGEVIGTLAVGYVPWTLIGNVQNSGSRLVGRTSGTARAEFYGLTGLSDRTFIGVSSTADFEEQRVVQAGHMFGDSRGNSLGLRASAAWSRPDLDSLDLRSKSLIVGLDGSTALVRSLDRNLTLGGGFELIDQSVRLPGGGDSLAVTRDKLRVAFGRLAGSIRAPRADGRDAFALGGSLELRKGLDLFGASERGQVYDDGATLSRAAGNPQAFVARGGFEGLASAGLASLAVSVQGQWANDPLLSIEEFGVGNLTIGRGYDPGITSGDRALGVRLEPRFQLPLRGTIGAQLFAFRDAVRIWNLDPFATENGRTLVSWGGGARFSLGRRFGLEAIYARPSDRGQSTDTRRAPDRLLISLTAQLSPAVRQGVK